MKDSSTPTEDENNLTNLRDVENYNSLTWGEHVAYECSEERNAAWEYVDDWTFKDNL